MCHPTLLRASRLIALPLAGLASGALPAQTVLRTFPLQHTYDMFETIGDIDGDGVRDLAFARWHAQGFGSIDIYSVRTGALLHQFVPPPQNYWAHMGVVRMGDVDADGYDDVSYVEIRPAGSTWLGYCVIRSGQSGAYLHQIPQNGMPALGLDDLNGDGRAEFLVTDSFANVGSLTHAGRVDVIDGATGQVIRSHVGTNQGQGFGVYWILGDVDGDGVRDYLGRDEGMFYGNPQTQVFSGATGAVISTFPKFGNFLKNVGDFNGDGYDDLILTAHAPNLFNFTGVYAGPGLTQALWYNYYIIGVSPPPAYYVTGGHHGDFDGDGYADIQLSGGMGVMLTLLAGRDGSVITEIPYGVFPAGQVPNGTLDGPGDANGDGFPDHWILQDTLPPPAYGRVLRLLSGAPPGVLLFGSGCPDQTGRTPTIGIGVGARLGKTLTVNLSHANPAHVGAFLGLGFSATMWLGTPLPLDLGLVGMPGCHWHVAADVALAVATNGPTGGRHRATHAIAVPSNPGLLGTQVFGQWLVLEHGPNGPTGSTTRAMQATIVP